MPPKGTAKGSEGAKGVLPVNAAARAAATNRGPTLRLKLEIRRLPPGLTLAEFDEILGHDWKPGNGKVDWREFRQGKLKHSLGKLPEQSRCYLRLVNEAVIAELEARFLAVVFQDKAGTHKTPDLKHLPPTIGYAPNQRTPVSAKQRSDNRQGTIDQDPEFIAFLEAETQPIVKPAALDSVAVEKENKDKDKSEKPDIKSTPLIEALREKKANKVKTAEAKSDKKDGKGGGSRAEIKEVVAPEKTNKDGKNSQQQKGEQSSKETPKAVNKQVMKQQTQQRPASPQQPQQKAAAAKGKKGAQSTQSPKMQKTAAPQQSGKAAAAPTPTVTPQSPTPRAPRQRGNAEGIKKMLQKDLGIRPKSATPAAQNGTPSQPAANVTPPANASTPTPPKSKPVNPPTAPKAQAQSKQQAQSPSAPATMKAYLKHANPSQGMTEILIQQALSKFGEVTNVTIDPRKGTAIALFKDAEGLKKAHEAKKVAVANGSVEVLEWKDRQSGGGGGGGGGGHRGGFRGGRGGGRAGGKGGAQNASAGQSPAPAAATNTDAGS
jgi:regulator of nonsense transcripts 3